MTDAEKPKGGRNFRDFLRNQPDIKYDPDRKAAMQVGDFIEISMSEYLSWVDMGQLGTPAVRARKIIGTTLAGGETEEAARDSRIVQVRIVEIEADRGRIVAEADGVRKRVDSSLFYNRFALLTDWHDVVKTNGDFAGFGPSMGAHTERGVRPGWRMK